MTMLSFRVPENEAEELAGWTEVLDTDRSELLRRALHRELVRLRSEREATEVEGAPSIEEESALRSIADWGPADDWSDWDDAEG